jgi:hypothetical protein
MLSPSQEIIHSPVVEQEIVIAAPIAITFETILEQLGPANELPDGTPMPMVLEAFPGGRWFRDLGNNAGHFWGIVQVIKPPTLLEICGPLFMSYPFLNHLQYRLVAEGIGTRLKLTHRGLGEILPAHRDGVGTGWKHCLERMKKQSEAKASRA